MYRPGEWEQLPSERDLNPFSRYEVLDPKRPIFLDDVDSALSESGKTLHLVCESYKIIIWATMIYASTLLPFRVVEKNTVRFSAAYQHLDCHKELF